jgi:hypothetical protein
VAIPVDAALPSNGDSSPSPPYARRPPEGTYFYQAAPGSEDYVTYRTPAATYSSVTVTIAYVGPDCFDQVFTFRQAYTETMHFCVKGYDLAEVTDHRDITLGNLVTIHTDETCYGEDASTPGDVYFSTAAKPTDSWSHHLTGRDTAGVYPPSSFEADGTYTYVEDKTLGALGNSKHFHDSRIVDGGEKGQGTVDWYFSPVDGALLRFTRALDIDYPILTGARYTERVDMTLTAVPPGYDGGIH